ncbi:MAG: S8 family serine peptidase [bacterium]|nr:S8 family serine peptidase [bacterium]
MLTAREYRNLVLVLLTALLGATMPAVRAAEPEPPGVPKPVTDPDSGEEVVVIARDWRSLYPFSARFAAKRGATGDARVIDLAAISFTTDDLVGEDESGGLRFHSPDLSSFPAELVRQPFADGSGDLFVVQAAEPKLQAVLRRQLETMGAEIRGYVPDHAYLARLTPQQHAELAGSQAVFWLGVFQPAWRIAPKLDYVIESDPLHQLRLTALFDRRAFAGASALAGALAADGVDVLQVAGRGRDWKVRLRATAGHARVLAAMPGCLWVERFAGYRLDNNVARTSIDTTTGRGDAAGPLMDVEDVWDRGLRGEGQIAAVSDTGLSTGDLATLHHDFGQQGSPTNPMRVVSTYALGRATWDDDQTIAGAGHGTHVTGSLLGNGARSGSDPANNDFPASSYAGTAPKAGLVFQSLLDSGGSLGGIPTDLNTLFQDPYDDGARVHSNSWGTPVDGQYTVDSQEVDEFVWNHPDMVITYTAGNSGNDGRRRVGAFCNFTSDPIDGVIDTDAIGAPGTAKNNLTVGASENYRPGFTFEPSQGDCTSDDGIEQKTWGWFSSCRFSVAPIFGDLMADDASGLGAFSSRGPTDDGRFKPDLVAPGIAVISTRTDQNQAYQQWGTCDVPAALEPYYITQGGTSMANPLLAGAAVLTRQYYEDGWHGEGNAHTNLFPVPADAFNPSAALIKATLINGAWDMTPGQYGVGLTQEIPPIWDSGADLPNNAEGYGRLDLEASLFPGSGHGRDPGRDMEVHDASPGLATGQFTDFPVSVASGTDALVVTLAWSDPYGDPMVMSQLVNDLDLTVTSPTATVYWPNGVDRTMGSADHTNNVEQVKVTSPAVGTWTVRVHGFSVPGNAETGSTVQPYALAISGVLAPPCAAPSAASGLAATPMGSNRIDLTWNPVARDSYSVHRATSPGGPYERIATGLTGTAYSDTSVSGAVTYYYVVTAINDPNCESTFSNEASATAFGDCTVAPTFTGLTSVGPADTGGSCVMRLEWPTASSPCPGPMVYNVYRSTTSGFIPGPANLLEACVTETFYDDASAVSGTEYHYVVRAEDRELGQGGACQDGNEDLGTLEISGEVGGEITTVLFADDFDGTQTPSDLWHFPPANDPLLANPYDTGFLCAPPPVGIGPDFYASDWYRPETGFCSGSTLASNDGTASPTYSDPNNGHVILGLPPSSGAPFTDGGVVLPTGVSSINLTFDHDYEFESSSENWDGGRVRISVDDWPNFVDLVPVGGYPGTVTASTFFCPPFPAVDAYVDDSGGCVSAAFDLTAYAGQRVWIAWNHGGDNDPQTDTGWAIDNVRLESKTPSPCATPPGAVQFLTATATGGQNEIEWLNPSAGSYGSTMIRWRIDTFPADPTDGTLLVDQAGTPGAHDSTIHGGLANGTTFYYAAFVDNGSGEYSAARVVASRPFDTSNDVKWAYSAGASALAPPGIGSVYGVANDRVLHSMDTSTPGGTWPAGWTPMAMNAPAQARPPVVPISLGAASKVAFLGSQDGRAYAVDADNGQMLWMSPDLGGLVQAAPAGIFTTFSGAHDLILVGTRNAGEDNVFHGLKLADGTVAWTFDNGGGANAIGIISSAATVDYTNLRVYFASRAKPAGSSHTVWCLSFTDTGASLLWSRDVGDVDGSPILHGGRVYVGTNAGEVHALDPDDGLDLWATPFDADDGPVKGYVWPRFGTSELVFSTTNTLWSIIDQGSSAALDWSEGSIPDPSIPLVSLSSPHAWVGGSDGKLHQLDLSAVSPTITSVTLGDGAATVGSPALDVTSGVAYVGTDAGRLYALEVPLSGARGPDIETTQARPPPVPASVPTGECLAVRVGSPQLLLADGFESGDLTGWNGGPSTSLDISATDVLDLVFEIPLAQPAAGEHLLRLRLLTPHGHLYQELTQPFSSDPSRRGESRAVEGFPRPLRVAIAETAAAGEQTVAVSWPVAGTPVVHSSLYGAWTVEAYLDDQTSPCGPSADFQIRD